MALEELKELERLTGELEGLADLLSRESRPSARNVIFLRSSEIFQHIEALREAHGSDSPLWPLCPLWPTDGHGHGRGHYRNHGGGPCDHQTMSHRGGHHNENRAPAFTSRLESGEEMKRRV